MIFHQLDRRFVLWAVGIMKVRLVHENHCVARRVCDEIAQLVLWRDAGGGVVRITDVNQTSICGGKHLGQIVGEGAGKWHLHHIGAIRSGVNKNRFKRRSTCDKLAPAISSKGFRAQFQNLARTVSEQDLIRTNVVELCKFVNQHVVVLIRITAA